MAFLEKAPEPGGTFSVEGQETEELLTVHVIVGKKLTDVAGEVIMPGGVVGDEGVDGIAFGRRLGTSWPGAGVEAVGPGVLVAPGRADGGPAAAVGRTTGRIGAADGPSPTGRPVGTGGGAAD
jgi:hypothetical protein